MSEPRWATWRDRPDLRPPLVWPWTLGGLFLTFLFANAFPEWPLASLMGLLGSLLPLAFANGLYAKRLVSGMDADGGEIPVRVRLYFGPTNEPLGADEGLLVQEEGWLIFRGLRSEWSVRRSDVEFDRNFHRFRYIGPEGMARYGEIDLLRKTRPAYGLLKAWLDAREPKEAPVFPPAVRSREATVASRLAFTVAMALVGGLFASTGSVVAGLGLAGGSILFFVFIEWRGYRRLRRAKALPER